MTKPYLGSLYTGVWPQIGFTIYTHSGKTCMELPLTPVKGL